MEMYVMYLYKVFISALWIIMQPLIVPASTNVQIQ